MKKIKDPGFGYSSKKDAKSIVNKNGSSNIIHENKQFSINETYSYLIQISWVKFFVFVFLSYLILNILFGLLFVLVGIEEITESTGSLFNDFLNGFFFSAQTITTVGYGGISPHGFWANLISSFEALIGLLGFSFITGLLYGRFSKPKSSVNFSENIILRDFKNGKAIMFRLMNNFTNIMIEPEISVNFAITKESDDVGYKKDFYELKLEFDKIKYLPTTWTIVHIIDSESPFFNLSDEEIQNLNAEWYILIQYHDDSFSQRVYQIHSYKMEDLKVNVQFVPATSYNKDGYTVLNHKILSSLSPLKN
tara:strand:+ start:9380 stop:10300 length:921 start_codon:yes stop_codon:yes gene_type:complete